MILRAKGRFRAGGLKAALRRLPLAAGLSGDRFADDRIHADPLPSTSNLSPIGRVTAFGASDEAVENPS